MTYRGRKKLFDALVQAMDRSDWQGAITAADRLREERPDEREWWDAILAAYIDGNDAARAAEAGRGYAARFPHDGKAAFYLGRIAMLADDWEGAEREFHAALGDPRLTGWYRGAAYSIYATFCRETGRPAEAAHYYELSCNCPSNDPRIPITLDEDGAIYYSSGTTGFPKAILHPHMSLAQAAEMEARHHETVHDDVFLCIPPLYHTGAKFHWMGSLYTGGRAVLLRGVSPRTILETVSSECCTNVWLLVPWAQDILMAIESGELKLEDYKLDQWRLMHIGAQPVPKSLIRRWKQIFPHHDYDTNYGLSESTGPGCVHLGLENIDHVGAIGVPGYRWECKVCSDQQGTEVPQGETGELWVKGPGVMRCYYNDPKATAETLHDGWLLTGDMARVDDDGFIWLVDRKKDVIIMGGENIYPVQIEDFLAGYPAIQDVAVIGIPDERLGEVSCAIIQLKPGHLDAEGNPTDITEQDIRDYCLDLPRYKRPRKIIFAPVPRNPTGKIEKPALRAKYGAENLVDRENQA